MRDLKELNIVVSGVGGQGQLFLSRIVGEIFMSRGIPAYIAETHGLSQRGGSVIVHIRIGRSVRAPLIPMNRAHIMISLEILEAARYIDYLMSNGVAIINRKFIRPPSTPKAPHEDELISFIKSRIYRTYLLPASKTAVEMGMPISANIYMIGSLIKLLDYMNILSETYIDHLIKDLLPERGRDINIKIYERGKKDLYEMIYGENFKDLEKTIFGEH
jgi:indolepyruvate ferredoxin oxidoreductase beta subunit